MNQKYENRVPSWCKDTGTKYDLMLSDDLDSLLSCSVLNYKMGWQIEKVMLFKCLKKNDLHFDILGKTGNATNEVIGVDIALQNGKCFDNHTSKLIETDRINNECINPNVWFNTTRAKYLNKYPLSTALLVWSIYNMPIPKSEEGKMILLCIDGSYRGYFTHYCKVDAVKESFKRTNKFFLCDVLGLKELYECQKRHTWQEFEAIKKKYRLITNNKDTKIVANGRNLKTNLDLEGISREVELKIELPTYEFHREQVFHDIQVDLDKKSVYKTDLNSVVGSAFSVALTQKNHICYSIPLKIPA